MRTFNIFTIVAACAAVVSASAIAPSERSAAKTCRVTDTPSSCPTGKYCHQSTCTAQLSGGKVCTRDVACKSEICFVSKPTGPHKGKRVCAPEALSGFALGDRCTQSVQCSTSYCERGFCATPLEAGQSCYKSAGCVAGSFCLKKAQSFYVDGQNTEFQPQQCSPNCGFSPLGQALPGACCTDNKQCKTASCGPQEVCLCIVDDDCTYRGPGYTCFRGACGQQK